MAAQRSVLGGRPDKGNSSGGDAAWSDPADKLKKIILNLRKRTTKDKENERVFFQYPSGISKRVLPPMTTKNIHHLIKAILASAFLTLGFACVSAHVLHVPSTQSPVSVITPGEGGGVGGENF